ncbi:thioesterase family protein [Nocardioides sp. GY 10127]|uniref:acyl-CoA thioesterase n=1 Tax=Nocardioides sp. GY 10127 TaxID=2569762 RepID=UPI0010A84F1C|nr:thioesterase family protein [Nocardioides sp. GY 10127]TIC81735.1 hypothetical protein E8D37_11130 [Nocardioides sp. GY 10127]
MTDQDTSAPFECEIAARVRDVNLEGHADNVELVRVLDEARFRFLRFAPLVSADGVPFTGVMAAAPGHVTELVAAHHVEYRAEVPLDPNRPYLVSLRVSRVGGSSLDVGLELRLAPDADPCVLAETTVVLLDTTTGRPWAMDDDLRAVLSAYAGTPVPLRGR